MRPILSTALTLSLALIFSGSANATLTWNWSFGATPQVVGPTATVYIPATIYNSSSSTANLFISGYSASPQLGFTNTYVFNFGHDLTFPWTSFTQTMQGLNLSPGQSYNFTFGTLTPQGVVPPGTYGIPASTGSSFTACSSPSFNNCIGQAASNSFLFSVPAPPPVPASAPPLSQLPPPSSLITSMSKPSFIANNIGAFNNNVASWLNQTEINIGSTQYSSWLKQLATGTSNTLTIDTRALNFGMAIGSHSLITFVAMGLELGLHNTNVNIALGSSSVADELLGVLLTDGDPIVAALSANTFIWGDLVAPQLKQFGQDPADPNYSQFYQVSTIPLSFSLASTGNPALDAAMSSLLQSSYRAAEDLKGANRSFDRYTSAYNNGDAKSALFQMEAILYYLNLYKQEAAVNASLLETAKALLDPVLPPTPSFDPAWLASMQQDLLTNGFPSEFSPLFVDFGLSNTDISNMQDSLLQLTANDFLKLPIDQGLGQIQQSMSLTASLPGIPNPTTVPEPSNLALMVLGLAGLGWARRRKKS